MNEALKPLKWYKKLSGKKERLDASAFLVEGPRAVAQIMASAPGSIMEILATDDVVESYSDYNTRLVTDSQLNSICFSQHPQGPVAVVRLPDRVYSGDIPSNTGNRLLLFEDVQDPGNVGTLIRTAAAFDYDGIIITPKCADPFSPKCVQASAGTVLSLWLRVIDDHYQVAAELKQSDYKLIAMDLAGNDDVSALTGDRQILALGNEANGLTSDLLDLADVHIKIPVNWQKAESLNVAACGAICMYVASRNSGN
ncbi:TrmH family RNA methyltransferase [Chloroflexota bacterium]